MFSFISFPSYVGQKLLGSEKTTKYFLKAFQVLPDKITKVKLTNNLFCNLQNLYQTNNEVKGPRINVGGDHSMAIASVAHSLNLYPNAKVIWFDAHPDINTFSSSLTKSYHGMPLAFLTGLDNDSRFDFIKNKLDFSNLLYIGIRDIDPVEKEIIEKYNIKWISVENLNHNTPLTITRINDFIDKKPVHISFDVDSLDPNIFERTGTPVPQGLQLEATKKVLDSLLLENMVNMDITEINLDLDGNSGDIPNLKYLFSNYFFRNSKI